MPHVAEPPPMHGGFFCCLWLHEQAADNRSMGCSDNRLVIAVHSRRYRRLLLACYVLEGRRSATAAVSSPLVQALFNGSVEAGAHDAYAESTSFALCSMLRSRLSTPPFHRLIDAATARNASPQARCGRARPNSEAAIAKYTLRACTAMLAEAVSKAAPS